MALNNRIQLTKSEFAELISEVDGLCPLCQEELIFKGKGVATNISQAAHIYPHSPSAKEKEILSDVPMLSDNPESIDNLLMLCPTCHYKFDHPRTRDEYMELYQIKRAILRQNAVRAYYKSHNLEEDLVSLFNHIESIDTEVDSRKLSYSAMTVREKMNQGASNGVFQAIIRNVKDYYLPIQEALAQIEYDTPGASDRLAKQVALFYSTLQHEGLTQDEIYYAINDWLDRKTKHRHEVLTPIVTAFYVQNCEVYSP